MRELKNGTKIIGVDHGYGNIKTANTIMPTSITAYQTTPTFDGNILIYDGMYYRIGEGCGCPVDTSAEGRSTDRGDSRDHKAFIADKSMDPYFETHEREDKFVEQIVEAVETAVEKALPTFLADFFMKLVRGSNIKVYRFDDEVKAIMHELRKIGVNLNQVAYLVNIMQDGEALRELHCMQNSICAAMDKLSAFLDKPLTEG